MEKRNGNEKKFKWLEVSKVERVKLCKYGMAIF
jgi:hypothetical protein